jgi:hypothetical protein
MTMIFLELNIVVEWLTLLFRIRQVPVWWPSILFEIIVFFSPSRQIAG